VQAADCAARAPSVYGGQTGQIQLDRDRLVIRVERCRLPAPDPMERELVQSTGAVLFRLRVALAARGRAAEVCRFPRPEDPDVVAEVRLVQGSPDTTLAALAPAALRRRTDRRRFTGAEMPDEVLRRLTEIAEREGVQLVPLVHESHRRLVARLTQQASRLRDADPFLRRWPRTWTPRTPSEGDDGHHQHPGTDQTMLLVATHDDDRRAWLRAGEAVQHVVLELTRLGWAATPLPQAVQVPITRVQLRASLTWDAHPQMLLQIGRAASTVLTPDGRQVDVSLDSRRAGRSLLPSAVTGPGVAPAAAAGRLSGATAPNRSWG
jgi:hypothetical protein